MNDGEKGLNQGLGGVRLKASSLRDQALRVIRAGIISGELRPDQLYAIGSIAKQLGVSITPVREAVLELSREGLVDLARNRGFRIREITERDLDEIVEFRRMIEVAAIRKIAEGKLLTDADKFRELANASEKCAAEGDWVGFLDNDRDFHMGLLAYLGNGRVLNTVGPLRDQSRLYGLDHIAGSESLMKSTHEHHTLLDALVAGHADKAAAIMDKHLLHARGIWAGQAEQSD
jgi:DNA-binding GntR family transcriptional regulator